MNTNDKPTPPDGYEVMLGKDLPSPIPDQTMFWWVDEWVVSGFCWEERLTSEGNGASWYAVPLVEASTPQKDSIGTDPKKAMGDQKPQLQLIPPALNNEVAKALARGAEKYGTFNWRENRVEVMTYLGAMKRHIDQFLDGEDIDPDTGAHHLGCVGAGCAIVLDARKHGTLVDNRPPKKQTA